MSFLRGVDVSSVGQGAVPADAWRQAAAEGLSFAVVRCGNGNNAPDHDYASNAKGAHDAGLVVGAYHVAFPLPHIDPVAQAEAHHAASGGLGSGAGELPPALDLEWPVPGSADWKRYGCTEAGVRGWALQWLARTRQLCGGKAPTLYDGFPDYWRAIGGDQAPAFAQYGLWVVEYPPQWELLSPTDDSALVVPGPWRKADWKLWQHSGGKRWKLPNGVPCDSDVFNGDAAALAAFCASPAA